MQLDQTWKSVFKDLREKHSARLSSFSWFTATLHCCASYIILNLGPIRLQLQQIYRNGIVQWNKYRSEIHNIAWIAYLSHGIFLRRTAGAAERASPDTARTITSAATTRKLEHQWTVVYSIAQGHIEIMLQNIYIESIGKVKKRKMAISELSSLALRDFLPKVNISTLH